MKLSSKTTIALLFICALAFGLTACGQRVEPKQPAGKINPSRAH